MSHHHDHDHHDHHHHDHHHHHHEHQSELSFEEKMTKLLEHWVNHNDDHAQNYRDWAEKANENNMAKVSDLLKDAADMTLEISKKFEQATEIMKSK
ncbi:hypothetical protein [Desulfonema magnum]|uniref:DUF8180 domain-containing protein n=1 Tax=Desulfonema magnum TaxID=45655 RepID=A0A975GSK5_9BACT|nr:hypothetical protein [Desulfonema magnum]QTA92129.1 Uncharacterized protein dnm_082040 [Desulfonema magnum]